jgi:ABC-type branched-subunit amino acid transport system substrate-binding protein
MRYFSVFVYRFFACMLLLALAACFMSPEEENEQEVVPPPRVISTYRQVPAGNPQSSAPAPSPQDYAPPSKLNAEEAAQAAQGNFAPPSHIGESSKAATVKVGLLIPMSGDSKALGKSLMDAAVLAIYDKYAVLSPREITAKVELLPEDTGDTVEGAEKAAQDAIQSGATLILGPVFGKQVTAVASIARSKHIPILTFSNNVAIAGEGVYLFGFIPEQQVMRIVQYAMSHKTTNIAALVPSNPYGAAIVKQLSAEVRKQGGRAYPIEYYPENMSALDVNVGRLARFLQDEPNKGQALFIAEGSQKLKVLADSLAANGITSANVQFLGTGLWDDPEITRWPSLSGGLFASSPPEKYHAFEQHFIATYGYKPERRASLSYDAVALASTIAISSGGNGFPIATLVDPVGFSGPANGIFRFHEDGTIERGLSVLQVTPQGFRTIDPAPTTFIQ